MFRAEDREHLRESLIARARADPHLGAAAAVGGSAGQSDRWSDLDLTFGVADGVPVETVLAAWTRYMTAECDAVVLFDLSRDTAIYRVFLLPGLLQVDLSFAPAPDFGARGPRFQLLFGEPSEPPMIPLPSPDHMFGLGVHHAVRGRICVERGRLWQAEYWISGVRDEALSLACCRRGLEVDYGRGFDRLPREVLDQAADALVGSMTVPELRRALKAAITVLVREGGDIADAGAGWLRSELGAL